MMTFFLSLNNPQNILLSLILFYGILKVYSTPVRFKKSDTEKEFITKLNGLHISKLYYEIFMVSLYLFFTVFLFILLRMNMLNKEIKPYFIDSILANKHMFYSLLLFLISVIFYIKIIAILFYPYIIRIHFYLFQYEWYRNYDEFLRNNEYWITEKNLDMEMFFYRISKYTLEEYCTTSINRGKSLIEVQKTFLYKTILYLNKHKWLYIIVKKIHPILNKINIIDSRFIHYLCYSIVAIVFIYDCFHGKIYFTFYASFYLIISINIRKYVRFHAVKDCFLDSIVTTYLYEKDLSILSNELSDIKSNLSIKESFIVIYIPSIREYMSNDFIREMQMIYHGRTILNKYKRKHVLLLLFLGVIYFYINVNKYLLQIWGIDVELDQLFFGITIMLCVVHHTMIKIDKTPNMDLESTKYKWIFRVIAIVIIIPMLYIMLKNRLTLNPTEVIFEVKNYIVITESFGLEEKHLYIKQYLDYLVSIQKIDKTECGPLFTVITYVSNDLQNMSMEEIKDLMMNKIYIPYAKIFIDKIL